MNVIDLLVRDHATVAALFQAFFEADPADDETRRDIVEQIDDELEDHAGAEEQLFCPEVERHAAEDAPAGELVRESHEEHQVIRSLLAELAEMQPTEEAYDAKVKVLNDMVQHHVREEESALLPRARRLLTGETLEELGGRIEADRAEQRTQRMAVASPDAVVPPPDDGPPSDWVRSGDVMTGRPPRSGRR